MNNELLDKDKYIIKFINQFNDDCKDNNFEIKYSYHFTMILKSVFGGDIYINLINHKFILKIFNKYYDCKGRIDDNEYLNDFIEWNKFKEEKPKEIVDKVIRENILLNIIQ